MASEIIRTMDGPGLKTVVRVGEGKAARYYLVSSVLTPDRGYETMVFSFSMKKNEPTSWTEKYAEHYNTQSAMVYGHERVCEHLEEYIRRNTN